MKCVVRPVAALVAVASACAAANCSSAAARAVAMTPDERDRRLDLGHDAHVPQQLFGAAEVLSHRVEERQPAAHVGIDVGLAVLDVGGIDQLAVDVVAGDGLDVVAIGDDAEAVRRLGGARRGRGDLAGLDEADARRAVERGEEPQEDFAVAVAAADDLLLPAVPGVSSEELVELGLDGFGEFVRMPRCVDRCIRVPLSSCTDLPNRAVAVAAADDVAHAVFVAIDGELVGGGQLAALVANVAKLRLAGWPAAAEAERVHFAGQRKPARAIVAVAKWLQRIDEGVPQIVTGFFQVLVQLFEQSHKSSFRCV